jgi:hypothetical protein
MCVVLAAPTSCSNCVNSYKATVNFELARSGCQLLPACIMAFRIVSNLRMQATKATLAGLPIRIRRSYISLITLLCRLAESEAMYRALRTLARPPQIERLPRFLPLSQLKEATPSSEAIFLRSRCPNSGNSANRVVAVTGPTPGTERRRFSFHATLHCYLVGRIVLYLTHLVRFPAK